MLELTEIQEIMARFGVKVQVITHFYDTSRGEADQRFNYILDDRYVLKVHSAAESISEERLREIRRLIGRYRSIGVYCPDYVPTLAGTLSYRRLFHDKEYICFVEEYAIYPVLGDERILNRKEVVEHLGILASKYTNVDLSETHSMWSIIDLAPFDAEIDEKQENANLLIATLRQQGYAELAGRVDAFNTTLREKIMTVFPKLPRCAFQGDLNQSNVLYMDGHFAGLIDFNMAGTDVNINVFLNETNYFPEQEEFDILSVSELLDKRAAEQRDMLSVIFRHYSLSGDEIYAFPYYKRIIDLFQYPNVCAMVQWLGENTRREKCAEMIEALLKMP